MEYIFDIIALLALIAILLFAVFGKSRGPYKIEYDDPTDF